MMDVRTISGFCLAVACIGMSGCGGVYDSTVSGTVTLDGNVVPRGTVTYHPATGGAPAYSPIQEDGAYSVRTGRESGLPAGEYQVTVTANEAPAQLVSKDGGPMPPGKSITPLWYRSKESSGLKYTVESGDNEINLELTSQPPAGWNPGRPL
jgi:hypothetical protein